MRYAIYGNSGSYVMPHTQTFDTKDAALTYARFWYPDNRHVTVAPATTHKEV